MRWLESSSSYMNLLVLFLLLSLLVPNGSSISAADNYQITVQVPEEFSTGFVGRAYLLEANGTDSPHFKAALSVEPWPVIGKYTCSLDVFIGDVRVWSSGHFSPFYASDRCYLELTDGGDLRLKQGPFGQLGWRSGTDGQGVERLELLASGNLVLLDGKRNIKWQSFNFPTNVMLRGQRLNVATRLTTPFLSNTNSTYSFEIQSGKLAMYLNWNKSRYSYWEYKPPQDKNISFIHLGHRGLQIFDQNFEQFVEIWATERQDLRYMSLSNRTGNLGLYRYSPKSGKFEASFEVLNETCELPLACKAYGVCTFSSSCSCIRLPKRGAGSSDCGYGDEASGGPVCDVKRYEMVELEGVESIFTYEPNKVNVSKEECLSLCMSDCKCKGVAYNAGECFVYGMIRGVRQAVARKGAMRYLIKMNKGGDGGGNGSFLGLKKSGMVLIGVADALILVMVFGGVGYYLIRKRRKNSTCSDAGARR